MAIVADKADPSAFVDRPLRSINRRGAGPIGSAIPLYVGELYQSTSTGEVFRGTGTAANTNWAITTFNAN